MAATILVVDDNEQNLTLIRVILRRHGYDSHLFILEPLGPQALKNLEAVDVYRLVREK